MLCLSSQKYHTLCFLLISVLYVMFCHCSQKYHRSCFGTSVNCASCSAIAVRSIIGHALVHQSTVRHVLHFLSDVSYIMLCYISQLYVMFCLSCQKYHTSCFVTSVNYTSCSAFPVKGIIPYALFTPVNITMHHVLPHNRSTSRYTCQKYNALLFQQCDMLKTIHHYYTSYSAIQAK